MQRKGLKLGFAFDSTFLYQNLYIEYIGKLLDLYFGL
jgi:hypothetical protein